MLENTEQKTNKNRHTINTKHNPEKANNAIHSKQNYPAWCMTDWF